jgi:hypothetical protein
LVVAAKSAEIHQPQPLNSVLLAVTNLDLIQKNSAAVVAQSETKSKPTSQKKAN